MRAVYHLVHSSDCAWSWQQHAHIAERLLAIVFDCEAVPISMMYSPDDGGPAHPANTNAPCGGW